MVVGEKNLGWHRVGRRVSEDIEVGSWLMSLKIFKLGVRFQLNHGTAGDFGT